MTTRKLLDNWSAPDDAGTAVACLATTFTFDPQFFTDDCLSRFLALTAVTGEGDKASSISAVVEEEQRLAEVAAISVLIDRGTAADKRNLRWDILPIPVSTGLLHAKAAVLIWEYHCRIVIGSANLTPAGYRTQIESAVAFDIRDGCELSSEPLLAISDELSSYLDLLPIDSGKARDRAYGTLRTLRERINEHALQSGSHTMRVTVSPSSPGVCPLDAFDGSWGSRKRPLTASILSPFWDNHSPNVTDKVRSCLTGIPAAQRSLTAVIGENHEGAWQAPTALADRVDHVRALERTDSERRALHAKAILLENDEWTSALIGSSNATIAGLGLSDNQGHRELNVWIGAPRSSQVGKALRALVRADKNVDLTTEPVSDENDEEQMLPALPLFFSWCTIFVEKSSASVRLSFATDRESTSTWAVREPQGAVLLTSDQWREHKDAHLVLPIDRKAIPTVFDVTWSDNGSQEMSGTWVATIDDTAHLPAPDELSSLTAEHLLLALKSTQPFPANVEDACRQLERQAAVQDDNILDPLRSFDSTSLLMHRMRRHSESLLGLKGRLQRPTKSLEILENRLQGFFGPVSIAQRMVDEARVGERTFDSETSFLIAEIALTVAGIDWHSTAVACDVVGVRMATDRAVTDLEALSHDEAVEPSDPSVRAYIGRAFEHARQTCGL
ncbi:phospholipase D-like domain-containing protein [Williamsia sterculiae]|uniref:Tyrosyl-DNA phosphodiesterase n=1 Tax=Williamsia sterculiae TaxID=1344003 RepID=A0A1N7HAV8_9NOCA|nr:hypothetical protein [Williamsia sterculiae]SIS21996.1 Tyrosyl-DNA phosphodiesterase [Williamsia sterculiae]